MKVWITKYVRTSGIQEDEAEVCLLEVPEGTLIMTMSGKYFYKPDWHTSPEDAKKQALIMISNRVISLKKQISRLLDLGEKFK